jgi:hypothetical protein
MEGGCDANILHTQLRQPRSGSTPARGLRKGIIIHHLKKQFITKYYTEGKIILEWTLGKQGGNLWTVFIWLRIGISGGFL